MANIHRLIILFFLGVSFPAAVYAQSAPVGAIDISGWIKSADGVWSRAFSDSNGTRATPTNTTVNSTSTALVQTSKGLQSFDIQKTASVDVGRIGASVAKLAKRVGPVGMAVGTVSLICELTNICNNAGAWLFNNPYSDPVNFPTTTPGGGFYITGGQNGSQAGSKEYSCSLVKGIPAWSSYDISFSAPTHCIVKYPGTSSIATTMVVYWVNSPGNCAPHYTLSGGQCVLNENANSGAPTDADWSSKAPLLNDSRFTPELNTHGEDLPTGVPTLTPNQKKALGLDSVPTKDSNGNITGREDTNTEIEAIDAGTTDNPGRVIIKETKTTIKYDTNNTQISSTTNTSYSSQPAEKDPPQYTISFDSVPEATLPGYSVPNTFSSDSWGSGTCPPNIDVALTNHSFTIPTQPICDTAEMINPFILLLASIISVYIIAGVRGGSAT